MPARIAASFKGKIDPSFLESLHTNAVYPSRLRRAATGASGITTLLKYPERNSLLVRPIWV